MITMIKVLERERGGGGSSSGIYIYKDALHNSHYLPSLCPILVAHQVPHHKVPHHAPTIRTISSHNTHYT